MSLIDQDKTDITSETLLLDTSNFIGNILTASENTPQKAFEKIEQTNFREPAALDSVTTTGLNVSNAVYASPPSSSISLTTGTHKAVMSFTGNFDWGVGTANDGKIRFSVSGASSFTKEFKIPYRASGDDQTLTFRWLTPPLTAGANIFDVEFKNDTNGNAELQLQTGGEFYVEEKSTPVILRTLTGNVKDGDNVNLDGVLVTANGIYTDTTDLNGDYAITGIPGFSAVPVSFSKTGYTTFNTFVNLSNSNQTLDINLLKFTLTGTVTSTDGNPISGATVEITALSKTTTTNGSGVYTLTDIPNGSHTVTANATGHVNYSNNVNVSGDTVYNFTMTAHNVTGTVTNSISANPVSGASISLPGLTAANSNGSGVYTLYRSQAGTFNLAASKSGYNAFSQSRTITVPTDTENISLVPADLNIFSGFIVQSGSGGHVASGLRFQVLAPCRVIGFMLRGQTAGGGIGGNPVTNANVILWTDGGTNLASVVGTAINNTDSFIAITPITLTVGQYYRTSVWTGSGADAIAGVVSSIVHGFPPFSNAAIQVTSVAESSTVAYLPTPHPFPDLTSTPANRPYHVVPVVQLLG